MNQLLIDALDTAGRQALEQFRGPIPVLAGHGDLYREHRGYPVVRVEQGKVSTKSVIDAPFGCSLSDAELAFET